MKYRITTNGDRWRIEHEHVTFWRKQRMWRQSEVWGPFGSHYPIEFNSFDEANGYLQELKKRENPAAWTEVEVIE